MKEFRIESDLLGELQVPKDAYYGVQTQRAIENFHISGSKMSDYPEFIRAFAFVKLAAAQANAALGVLPKEIGAAIEKSQPRSNRWKVPRPIPCRYVPC